MKEEMKKIAKLSYDVAMIEFKEHLTDNDYSRIEEKEKEIRNLMKKIDGGWVVEFNQNERPYYLTSNSSLCYSDTPTFFESEDEAKSFLDNQVNLKNDIDYGILKYNIYFKKNPQFEENKKTLKQIMEEKGVDRIALMDIFGQFKTILGLENLTDKQKEIKLDDSQWKIHNNYIVIDEYLL